MIALIFVCLWIIFFSYTLYKRYSVFKKIKNVFLNVIALKQDLHVYTTGILGKPRIKGNIGDNYILFELLPGLTHSIEIRIIRPDDFPYYLQISDRLYGNDRSSLIQTNDENFNKRIVISSYYTTGATALMDKDTRTIMNKLFTISHQFTLEGNRIALRISYSKEDFDTLENKTKHALNYTMELITKLTRQGSIKDFLSDNTLSDPDTMVRRRNLELLISHFNFEDLKNTLKKALNDQDKEVQYMAANNLGKEGLPYLYKLFDDIPSWDTAFKLKVISSIVRIQGKGSMGFLIKFFNTLKENEQKIKSIHLFKYDRDKQVNNLLLDQLKRDIDHELKLAVINALGRCGTLDAVEPLYQVTKQIIILPSLKTAAKQSIACIQSRFGSGEKGWLSIMEIDDSEGSLSLIDDDDDESE